MLDVLKFYDSTGNGRQKYLSFSSSGESPDGLGSLEDNMNSYQVFTTTFVQLIIA